MLAARRQAREALGRDPIGGDPYGARLKRKTTPASPQSLPIWSVERPHERPDQSVGVLSLGEAARRLGVSRSELEAMIDAGQLEALPSGFTRMIPSREVDWLMAAQ